ncbi:hypothetical protein EJB05_44644 [Eragrostis curvula]|uniref:Uncharacterized protein n=1 Tax=Eragrostis curvula TaxID=38414 RepID=A0A5J9TK83_9POAL|nr:hypothetical protein EJB05_44644 [Eragrostis curvula]
MDAAFRRPRSRGPFGKTCLQATTMSFPLAMEKNQSSSSGKKKNNSANTADACDGGRDRGAVGWHREALCSSAVIQFNAADDRDLRLGTALCARAAAPAARRAWRKWGARAQAQRRCGGPKYRVTVAAKCNLEDRIF